MSTRRFLGKFQPRNQHRGFLQQLPLGPLTESSVSSQISTFSLMQKQGFNLVDKTAELQRILAMERKFLLCRPPRFGKTMTMTTLASLFSGEKELFDGTVGRRLAIADKWDWNNERHAVLHFNMSAIARRRDFESNLRNTLVTMAAQLGISDCVSKDSVKIATRDLISSAAKLSSSGKVVILVDEVDAPVSETLFMDQSEVKDSGIQTNSKVLNDFFEEIEAQDDQIRFQMYMGIGNVKIPGYISDLTFDEAALALVGYTNEDIHASFGKRFNLLQERLQESREGVDKLIEEWYGGYNWGSNDVPTIHNPFAVNELMRRFQFGPYWSIAMEPMLWLLSFISNRAIANPFQGKIPLMPRTGQQPNLPHFRNQTEYDVHLLLLKLGLLSIHSVDVDEDTLIRTGVLGVPNLDVDEYSVGPLIDAFYRAQNDMM